VQTFLHHVDRETGSMGTPWPGGWMDQPARSMDVFGQLQALFCEKLAEEAKKLAAKRSQVSHIRR
jgi:hypothetical protein